MTNVYAYLTETGPGQQGVDTTDVRLQDNLRCHFPTFASMQKYYGSAGDGTIDSPNTDGILRTDAIYGVAYFLTERSKRRVDARPTTIQNHRRTLARPSRNMSRERV